MLNGVFLETFVTTCLVQPSQMQRKVDSGCNSVTCGEGVVGTLINYRCARLYCLTSFFFSCFLLGNIPYKCVGTWFFFFFFSFNDVSIPKVFYPTRTFPQVVPAKPKQMHTGQVWGVFKYKTWEVNPDLTPLHPLPGS